MKCFFFTSDRDLDGELSVAKDRMHGSKVGDGIKEEDGWAGIDASLKAGEDEDDDAADIEPEGPTRRGPCAYHGRYGPRPQ